MDKESYNLKTLTKKVFLGELFSSKLYFWAMGKTNNKKTKMLLEKLQNKNTLSNFTFTNQRPVFKSRFYKILTFFV